MNYTVARANISSSPLQYSRDLVAGTFKDYLFFRVSDTEHYLIVGDISFDDYTFSDCDVYQIVTLSIDPVGSYYSLSELHNQSGSVSNPYAAVVYGSAAELPHLVDRGGVSVAFACLVAISVFTCTYLFMRIFHNVSH